VKIFEFYSKTLKLEDPKPDIIFNYFMENLKPSIMLWNYFVNWKKVEENTRHIEISLNILNYLIGKENFDKEFAGLIKENPGIIAAIPALAVRDGDNTHKFKILVDYRDNKFKYDEFDFTKTNPTNDDIEKYLAFVNNTGIADLLKSQKIKNLVDYIFGVEAGLDSNGRKNRSGDAMENIVGVFLKDLCDKKGYRLLPEANASVIRKYFQYDIPVAKSSRRYDFAIDNGRECFLLETNYYSGGGSKLKATAGEYRGLYNSLQNQFKFIWITDGKGWEKASKPLRETFDHIDYLFNLDMLEKGVLEFLLD
jgi:type II restriction enzyme